MIWGYPHDLTETSMTSSEFPNIPEGDLPEKSTEKNRGTWGFFGV